MHLRGQYTGETDNVLELQDCCYGHSRKVREKAQDVYYNSFFLVFLLCLSFCVMVVIANTSAC